MKIIAKFYRAVTGYRDLSPGQTPFSFFTQCTEDGTLICGPANSHPIGFNEIQVEGDVGLRETYLPTGTDSSSILLLSNPDYKALFFRRQLMSTKDIPLTQDEDFVRRWAALATQPAQVIELGITSDVEYFDNKSWGKIDIRSNRNGMLDYIKQMDSATRDSLKQVENDAQWAAEFILWRDTLTTRIKYQEVTDG